MFIDRFHLKDSEAPEERNIYRLRQTAVRTFRSQGAGAISAGPMVYKHWIPTVLGCVLTNLTRKKNMKLTKLPIEDPNTTTKHLAFFRVSTELAAPLETGH